LPVARRAPSVNGSQLLASFIMVQGVPLLTADLSLLDDASTETLSTLEALNDIADTVETIVLGFNGEQEQAAYLSWVDDYEDYAETLPDSAALRTQSKTPSCTRLESLRRTPSRRHLQMRTLGKTSQSIFGLTLTSALALAAFSANAADAYQPVGYKDGLYAPVATWTGFYAGVNAGYAWTANTNSGDLSPSGGFAGGQIGYGRVHWLR
jgi:hypothetical protein